MAEAKIAAEKKSECNKKAAAKAKLAREQAEDLEMNGPAQLPLSKKVPMDMEWTSSMPADILDGSRFSGSAPLKWANWEIDVFKRYIYNI